MTSRLKKSQAMRARLVTSSLERLRIFGCHATGVQEIADAAGAPKGSFYNHFASKDDFIVAALETYLEEALRSTSASLAEVTEGGYQRLYKMYAGRIQYERQRLKSTPGCLLSTVAHEMAGSSDKVRQAAASAIERMANALTPAIAAAIAERAIEPALPAEQLASYLESSWRGALLVCRGQKSTRPLEQFLEMLPVIVGKKTKGDLHARKTPDRNRGSLGRARRQPARKQ
jgi:TetR/AcrR family transcriptional regulator, transcriptional repressor for nem operon